MLIATSNPPSTSFGDVTVKVTVWSTLVSVIVGALIDSVLVSSLPIVPVADAPVLIAAICVAVALLTVPKTTLKVSCASTIVSPLIVTLTDCVSPGVPLKWTVVVTSS